MTRSSPSTLSPSVESAKVGSVQGPPATDACASPKRAMARLTAAGGLAIALSMAAGRITARRRTVLLGAVKPKQRPDTRKRTNPNAKNRWSRDMFRRFIDALCRNGTLQTQGGLRQIDRREVQPELPDYSIVYVKTAIRQALSRYC